ncbi:helix-turn-helix domain-containing protein [Paenibacillus sp. sgz5001063]
MEVRAGVLDKLCSHFGVQPNDIH